MKIEVISIAPSDLPTTACAECRDVFTANGHVVVKGLWHDEYRCDHCGAMKARRCDREGVPRKVRDAYLRKRLAEKIKGKAHK